MSKPNQEPAKVDHESLFEELRKHAGDADVGKIDDFSIVALLALSSSRAREILTTQDGNIDDLLANARKDAGDLLTFGDGEDEKIQNLKERVDISRLLLGLQWSAAYEKFEEYGTDEFDRLSENNENARNVFSAARNWLTDKCIEGIEIEDYIPTPYELTMLTLALQTLHELQEEERDRTAGAEYGRT